MSSPIAGYRSGVGNAVNEFMAPPREILQELNVELSDNAPLIENSRAGHLQRFVFFVLVYNISWSVENEPRQLLCKLHCRLQYRLI